MTAVSSSYAVFLGVSSVLKFETFIVFKTDSDRDLAGALSLEVSISCNETNAVSNVDFLVCHIIDDGRCLIFRCHIDWCFQKDLNTSYVQASVMAITEHIGRNILLWRKSSTRNVLKRKPHDLIKTFENSIPISPIVKK